MSHASLRRALEDELAGSPDDLATHAAYADLLQEQGDPRGEFIQLQVALEDPELPDGQRGELARRERELWRANEGRWLGWLLPHLSQPTDTFSFRRGWLDTLEVRNLSLPLARALRDAPQARMLRHLAVESAADDTPPEPDDNAPEGDEPGYWPLVGAPGLANLRIFRLGEDQGDDPAGSHSRPHARDAVVPLVRSMPRLEELYLYSRCNRLTELFTLPTLRNLRVLKAYHQSQVHRLDVLAANPAFRRLTHLLLHPHALAWHDNGREDGHDGFAEAGGYLPLRVVEALARSPNLPQLHYLQLRCSSMGDEGARALAGSGLLARLRSLDLRHGRVGDAGARALAECPDLRALKWLDLGRNSLSREGTALLCQLGIACRLDDQHDPAGDEEDDYLQEGDTE